MRVIGLAGWSGAGKTTLLTRVIPELKSRDMSVSTIKHAHHKFDIDTPGKDSHEHRLAGAQEVLVASANRWALMHELRDEPEWSLRDLVGKLSHVDLVIVEGFKTGSHPKIEVFRSENGKPFLYPGDRDIVAIASDMSIAGAKLPVVQLDDIAAIADLMMQLAVDASSLFDISPVSES
jgi:molybdopterin-guanine dinucleotide biosynthesis adapter protein